MSTKSIRAKVVDEARLDAAAYYQEFRQPIGTKGLDWVTQAWADIRRDFGLDPETADGLWPAYWEAFSAETVRLASIPQPPPAHDGTLVPGSNGKT